MWHVPTTSTIVVAIFAKAVLGLLGAIIQGGDCYTTSSAGVSNSHESSPWSRDRQEETVSSPIRRTILSSPGTSTSSWPVSSGCWSFGSSVTLARACNRPVGDLSRRLRQPIRILVRVVACSVLGSVFASVESCPRSAAYPGGRRGSVERKRSQHSMLNSYSPPAPNIPCLRRPDSSTYLACYSTHLRGCHELL